MTKFIGTIKRKARRSDWKGKGGWISAGVPSWEPPKKPESARFGREKPPLPEFESPD
jgi:hypothetical protein